MFTLAEKPEYPTKLEYEVVLLDDITECLLVKHVYERESTRWTLNFRHSSYSDVVNLMAYAIDVDGEPKLNETSSDPDESALLSERETLIDALINEHTLWYIQPYDHGSF